MAKAERLGLRGAAQHAPHPPLRSDSNTRRALYESDAGARLEHCFRPSGARLRGSGVLFTIVRTAPEHDWSAAPDRQEHGYGGPAFSSPS